MARGIARRSTRAQALVETAIVVVMLLFMIMGIVEVGWAFMRTSMIEHAARDGARYGATLGNSTGNTFRDGGLCFTGTGTSRIQSRVTTQLTSIAFTPQSVAVCQACDGTIPITKVTITGTLDMLFGFIPGGPFAVNRQFTFQDEPRACPDQPCNTC
jgi:hypothetical protein